MEYTKLGNTGTDVSQVCFGTWRFGKETDGEFETDYGEAHDLLDACEDLGINFIDTANVYGDESGTSEEWIGDWLAERDREDYVLASKVYFPFDDGPNGSGLGRKHIRAQIEGTLDRLGTDYLDLYYIHRWDESVPIEETLRTLDQLVEEGKVNHLGASSMAAWQLTKALWTSDVEGLERFEVTQPRFNAASSPSIDDYLDVCADQNLAVCPYSPLQGGFLTGKYERTEDGVVGPDGARIQDEDSGYITERGWRVLDELREIAETEDTTPARVAIRWLIDREAFTCIPIFGARSPEQLEENAGAVDVDLSADQLERITAAREGEN